ncbi:MAG: TraB/GumN family protein [Alphaproteobacteria bacterium]|nr:TraB/GumN family protein [Alphaproteobacteria bacterium]MBV9370459.1 TraB/GumN family protein [Alphaproteobacteria bacterium]MBV9900031.1 TraB/GumN family protein [Alphaproteobacteria bacterium]
MKGASGAAAVLAVMMAGAPPSASAQPPAQAEQAHVNDIVVTGRRSGIPLWTVRSETTTLVLVGAIGGVSKTTKWDPEALTEALRKADRVVFPEAHGYTASPFSVIGWLAKYNKMGSLPKGRRLSAMARPDDMRRLAALAGRGMVRRDYDGRHPLHLANDLRDRARDGVKFGRSPADYVLRTIKRYKLALVPMPRSKAKPLIKDLFASRPEEHLPCLHAAIAVAEAGPAEFQARSDAWAARRVQAVLASPIEAAGRQCWPDAVVAEPGDGLTGRMKQLLGEPEVTVAVLSLGSLAAKGGILDGLEAAGFDIQGPRWKE